VGDREDRQQRRVKKLASKDLPYSLDSAKLLDMVPELDRDRGLGRVLREVVEATQGNFDHMRSELKRNTDYHNEHAEETNFIKDEVIPHEHPSDGQKVQVGQDEFDQYGGSEPGHFITPHNYGSGLATGAGVDGYSTPTALPVYIDKPCTFLQLRIQNYVSAPLDKLFLCIYAGDGDGNFPDTLLLDVTEDTGLPGNITADYTYTPEFELDVGPGWLWLTLVYDTTTPGIHTNPEIASYDNGWAFAPIDDAGHWPFPMRWDYLDSGDIYAFNSVSMFTLDWPNLGPGPYVPPVAQFMDDWQQVQGLSTPFYSSYAPIIEYRVR